MGASVQVPNDVRNAFSQMVQHRLHASPGTLAKDRSSVGRSDESSNNTTSLAWLESLL